MTYLITEILLAASDEDDTFWIQLLVLVVLGAAVGVGSLIKARANRLKTQEQYRSEGGGRPQSKLGRQFKAVKELKDKSRSIILKSAQPKTETEPTLNFEAAETIIGGKQKNKIKRTEGRDVDSGMELLELDFLLSIVENTKGNNKKDVMMRKLVFNELIRREQLDAVDSKALNIYTINKDKLYNKDIQRCAMKELAERTKPRS